MVLGAGALGREFGLDEVMNVHLYDETGVLIKERKRLNPIRRTEKKKTQIYRAVF